MTMNRFQTYISSVVLLHSVVQKQIQKMDPLAWQEDLDNARRCLDILDFCGLEDAVALSLASKARRVYDSLVAREEALNLELLATAALLASHREVAPGVYEVAPPPRQYLLIDLPAEVEQEERQLALSLLVMLCRPFGDPESGKRVGRVVKEVAWRTCPKRYEYPDLMERLQWDFEASLPFQWDFERLAVEV